MKIFGILGAVVLLVILGAFTYIAVSDVPVTQTMVVKDIVPDTETATAPPASPAAVAPAAGTTAPQPAPAAPAQE